MTIEIFPPLVRTLKKNGEFQKDHSTRVSTVTKFSRLIDVKSLWQFES